MRSDVQALGRADCSGGLQPRRHQPLAEVGLLYSLYACELRRSDHVGSGERSDPTPC